ncbi:hypothetical protein BTVI_48204 [Pitangus sulphuratus]|nr:hypothetical protein BTVI_48204 [Pitangus sulphuratus]
MELNGPRTQGGPRAWKTNYLHHSRDTEESSPLEGSRGKPDLEQICVPLHPRDAGTTGLDSGDNDTTVPTFRSRVTPGHKISLSGVAEAAGTSRLREEGRKNSNCRQSPRETEQSCVHAPHPPAELAVPITDSKLAVRPPSFTSTFLKSVSMYPIFTDYSIIIPTIPRLGVG